jgi:archaellum component FlaF (FlaF/FlaG flagellin family)
MNQEMHEHQHQGMKMSYRTFAGMILTSMVVMYGLMYLNTYEFAHVRWSETRLYMTFIMGAAMAVIMLSFMRGMYSNKKLNLAIYLGSLVVFLLAFFLVRSQILVGDSSYMSAMIPHHSIAILTSENAQIEDVRVRELADGIIEAQRREIDEMNWLLADIAENGVASTQEEADARPVHDFEGE